MAAKQVDVVKQDDTKQGVNHKALHQGCACAKHQVMHQDDTNEEGVDLQDAKNEATNPAQVPNPEPTNKYIDNIKQRYFAPPRGFITVEDEPSISPEELQDLIDRDPDIGRILPNLYISQASCSIDPAILQEHNITSILSITTEFHPEWESPAIRSLVPVQRHLLLPADDNKVMNLLPFFESICDWIDGQIETPSPAAACNGKGDNGKNNVLVHCWRAVSRSPTICLAYYLRKMYPNHDPRTDPSFEKIYRDFDHETWTRTWANDTSTFVDQLKVWFDTGYQVWEDKEKRTPKKEYKRFLENVREPERKALQEVWKDATGEESGWEDDQLGLAVVGVKDHHLGDVTTTTWDEAKEIMDRIPKEKTLGQRMGIIRRYVYGEKKKKEGALA